MPSNTAYHRMAASFGFFATPSKPKCEGCDGSGIRPYATPHAGDPPYGYVVVEKCDTCDKFATDLEAAAAYGIDAHWQIGKGTEQAVCRLRAREI